ncbi:hypothetical protein PLESTF_000725500 [Pleodorina starrii]|nr:hypothetical protein PLESTF_000725500 [Pleodorina starrii]
MRRFLSLHYRINIWCSRRLQFVRDVVALAALSVMEYISINDVCVRYCITVNSLEFAAAFVAVVEPLFTRLRLHADVVRNAGRVLSLAWLHKCGEVPVVPATILWQKVRKTKAGDFPTADLLT